MESTTSARIQRPVLALVLAAGVCLAQNTIPADLSRMDIEGLMNVKVTSVSKKEQSLSKLGAAVFVITQEDIRRSGMTNIPDLLRMAPGVDVARINANVWAIGIRGFNARYSRNVLVLIDGRTVYSPDSSGAYWDQLSVPLEDIDRIEVIRGPGGTVWGANAVSGVINIITMRAQDTQGALVSAETGTREPAQTLAQYGGSAGRKGHYRIYGRYFNLDESAGGAGPVADAWHGVQAGFRADWNLSRNDRLTVQGDMFGASEDQMIMTTITARLPGVYTLNSKIRVGTGNILGRWDHGFSNGSEATVQLYYDHVNRLDTGPHVLNTGDFDFHYRFHAGSRNDIVAGAGFRATDQSIYDLYSVFFASGHRRDRLYSTFIQDEIRVTDRLSLTIGSKFEHNGFTGFEYEPGVQLVWTPSRRRTIWASASKAIQQPSWYFAEARNDAATFPIEGGSFALLQFNGNPRGRAPRLFDYEVGYRAETARRITLDGTVFFNQYRRLLTIEPQAPYFTTSPAPPHLVLPNATDNLGKGTGYGGEFSASFHVADWWRIRPGLSFLQMHSSLQPGSQDTSLGLSLGDSPKYQGQMRSTMNLPHRLQWDTSVFYVGGLRAGPVPSYVRVDSRLGRRFGESVEFSVAGQNLLSPRHLEFLDGVQVVPAEACRGVFAKVTWRF